MATGLELSGVAGLSNLAFKQTDIDDEKSGGDDELEIQGSWQMCRGW